MKFKKVEVSAFRIYNEPKDAIFDFTIENASVANFVSLYAPNGFGKTSFYDAIEWGITNNVQRFWQNKNTQESIDALRASTNEQVKLLRNNSSGANLETYVKITTDSEALEPRILKVHGGKKSDINKSEDIENPSFRQVILSQEWISAFLKEVDGERRYQLFMQNPDLAEIDNYYIAVKALYRENQRMIGSINDKINFLKQEIQPENDFNPLEKINSQINEINKELEKVQIQLITPNMTKEQLKDFKDVVSDKIVIYSKESSIKEKLSQIKKAKIGDNLIIGIDKFYNLNKDLKEIKTKLDDINTNLEKFKELEKNQTEVTNLKKNLLGLNKQESEHKDILKEYDYYKVKKEGLQEKARKINSLEKEQLETNKQTEALTRQKSTIANQNEGIIKQRHDLEKQEKELPNIKKRIDFLENEIEKLDRSVKETHLELNKKTTKINSIDEGVKELEKVKNETNNSEYSLMHINENSELVKLTETLEKLNKRKRELNIEIGELNTKVEQQKSLNSTIEEFIKSGLIIANDLQKSTCPLCEYQYNSYKELAENISNNKALNLALKELLSLKNKLNEDIKKSTAEINDGNGKLIVFYNEKVSSFVKERRTLEAQKANLNKVQKEKAETLKKLNNELKEISVKLNGLTYEEFKKQLDTLKLKNTNDSNEISNKLSEINKKLSNVNEKYKNTKSQLELLRKEIQLLKNDEKYLLISNWLNNNLFSSDKTKIELEKKIEQISSKLKNIKTKIIEGEELTQKHGKELSKLTKENLIKNKSDLQKSKVGIEQKIEEYTYFVNDKFDIDVYNFDKKSLTKFLEEEESTLKLKLKKYNFLKEGFAKLEKYAENIYPFLQSEKAKRNLKKKEEELNFIKKEITPLLEDEKEKAKEEIDRRIRDFFYEKLINEIYRKIDPHPDFKSVKFVADFDSNNPRLDIFVENLSNEETLIPNLYFSTAQINILSLSIFLASALNSNEYDCIFIDDPIQSMDSINVLSTIDLFRSIIVNENKQIVLSTHDENFFNLLKRKIPKDIFKSKFLELESFGKLKKDKNDEMLLV
ncbi:MAG: AAA family ATPase [Flavobacteriaceae bacterium]